MTGWLIWLPVSEMTLWFVFKTLLLDLGAPEADLLPKSNLTSLSLWPGLVGDPQIFDWCGDYIRSMNSLDLVLYQCWLDLIPRFLGSQLLPSDLFQGLVTPWCVKCNSASCNNKHCLLVASFQCQLKGRAFCISRRLVQYLVGDIKQELVSWAVWFLHD